MSVIIQQGFPAYFLIVQEYIEWARSQGIGVGPGRGSAAGAIVAYAMGITDLDPLSNGLLFERFLSPERVEMPDIDVDFEDERRGEVIEHIKDVYGEDHVSGVITFGKLQAEKRRARRRARPRLPVFDRRQDHQDDRRRARHHHRQGSRNQPRSEEGLPNRRRRQGRHRRRALHRRACARRGRARVRDHHLP